MPTYTVSGNGSFPLDLSYGVLQWTVTAYPSSIGLRVVGSELQLFGAGWVAIAEDAYGVREYRTVDFTRRLFNRPGVIIFGAGLAFNYHLIPGVILEVIEIT